MQTKHTGRRKWQQNPTPGKGQERERLRTGNSNDMKGGGGGGGGEDHNKGTLEKKTVNGWKQCCNGPLFANKERKEKKWKTSQGKMRKRAFWGKKKGRGNLAETQEWRNCPVNSTEPQKTNKKVTKKVRLDFRQIELEEKITEGQRGPF